MLDRVAAPLAGLAKCVAVGVAVAVSAGACAAPDSDGDLVVIRVAAPFGMGPLVPSREPYGSVAAALDLVYVSLNGYASIGAREDASLVLNVRPGSRLSAEQLAAAIRFDGLEDVVVESPARLRLVFSDAETRTAFERDRQVVSDGPFRVDEAADGVHRLVRRGAGAIDMIEIREVTTEEQWRRLLGRRLDVVPLAEERSRAALRGVDTVRTIDVEHDVASALFFDLSGNLVRDVRVRRQVVRAIDRAALAQVMCGSARCESVPAPVPDPGGATVPKRLALAVPRGYDEWLLAAEVVRHQLRAHGIDVALRRYDAARGDGGLAAPDIDMALAPWRPGPDSYHLFLTPEPDRAPFTGYANPEYDRAVANGDLETAQTILDRDVPMTPLYRIALFAAVDNRWCGDVTPSATSWRWIADLRPCAPGEVP